MGRYKHITTMHGTQVTRSEGGYDATGATLRIEMVARPEFAPDVRWIETYRNGVGETTEQFSRSRRAEAEQVYTAAVAALLPEPPAPSAPKVAPKAAPGGAEQVVETVGAVLVVMIKGSRPRFEVRTPAGVQKTIPATRAWRTEQQQAVAFAQSLAA